MTTIWFQKVRTVDCLPLCTVPSSFLLTTLFKAFGHWRLSWLNLASRIFPNSSIMQVFSCAIIRDLHCRSFITRHTFSVGDRWRTAGRSGKHTYSVFTQQPTCNPNRMQFSIVLLENNGIEGHSICYFKICTYFSAWMMTSQICNLPMLWALAHPHSIINAGFWI